MLNACMYACMHTPLCHSFMGFVLVSLFSFLLYTYIYKTHKTIGGT
eukprot:UN14840